MRASFVFLILAACPACRRDPAPVSDAAAPAVSVVAIPSVSASASASAAPVVVEPKGTVQLVVQLVSSLCSEQGGARGKIGNDVLIETKEDGAAKATVDFTFCPKSTKPHLDTWQNCKAFPTCKDVSPEGGASAERVELECGKEHISIESSSGKTILKGSFGEREIAPHPMKILPIKRTKRDALVDC